jgi:hypothetical protein
MTLALCDLRNGADARCHLRTRESFWKNDAVRMRRWRRCGCRRLRRPAAGRERDEREN